MAARGPKRVAGQVFVVSYYIKVSLIDKSEDRGGMKLSKIKKNFSRYFLHLMRCLNFWDNKNF